MRTNTLGTTANVTGQDRRTNVGFTDALPTQTNIEDVLAQARPQPIDGGKPVVAATTTPDVAQASGHSGIGKKIALAALSVGMLVGGGMMMPSTASAQTIHYNYQNVQACYDSPYAYQDQALMNHLAGLSNNAVSGFNHAAGVYDGRADFSLHSLTKNRLDGDQAYNRLTCNMPVRLYSPQTGWLKFNNIPDLHHFVSEYGQPWDNPNSFYGYSANSADPWYDGSAIQYNQYDFSSYNFYNVPQYVAPPSNYAPPADWQSPGNTIPGTPAWQQNQGGGANAAPIDTHPVVPQNNGGNAAPVDQRPVVPSWQQNQAPPSTPSWQQGNNSAPVDRTPVVPTWQPRPAAPAPSTPAWQQHQAAPSAPAWQQHSAPSSPAPRPGGAPVQNW
jgi:hypothetical protein